jgi:5-methylcytosine-specific restriction endonuclease McrA
MYSANMRKTLYPVVDGMKQCSCCKQVKLVSEFHRKLKGFYHKCKQCHSKRYLDPIAYTKILEYSRKYQKTPNAIKYAKEYRKKNRDRFLQWQKLYRSRPEIIVMERSRRVKYKQNAVDMAGGKCSVCGYCKCISALEFHHLDPSEKEISIRYGLGREKLESELKKCVLLCANCHREVHSSQMPPNNIIHHGSS